MEIVGRIQRNGISLNQSEKDGNTQLTRGGGFGAATDVNFGSRRLHFGSIHFHPSEERPAQTNRFLP
jgi:hypothetical protein